MSLIDISGQIFGKLTVLSEHRRQGSITQWLCQCECGNKTWVARGKLTSGHTRSCGCIVKKYDGLSDHPLYGIYANIKYRCYNPNCQVFENWGGRGIVMCQEWFDDFTLFYDWSIENGYQFGLTIDRIDNDGNYEPDNCQWITRSENTAKANLINHRRKTEYIYYGIDPHGKRYEFTNANQFGETFGINPSEIRKHARKSKTRKCMMRNGWRFGFTDKLNN